MVVEKRLRKGISVALCVVMGATLFSVRPAPVSAAGPNPVVVENAKPGTADWRIGLSPYNVANDVNKQIKGYASATSINKGETIDLKVTVSPAQPFSIKVFRIGWYGGLGGRLLTTVGPLPGVTQDACPADPSTGLIECHWSTSYTLAVPSDWTSGIYLAQLTSQAGFQNNIQFVVRDDARVADLLYQLPVANYQAYNNYPSDGSTNCGTTVPATGKNLYDSQSAPGNTVVGRPRAVKVSFDRPYACGGADDIFGPDWSWDGYFIHWLERNGYDVCLFDQSRHPPARRPAASTTRDSCRSVTTSTGRSTMFDAAEAARDAGVNLAFFGGERRLLAGPVRALLERSADRVMVGYKNTPNNTYSTLDPYPDPKLRTGALPGPAREPTRAEPPRRDASGRAPSGRRSIRPYVVQNSDHWMYAGTGFQNGSTVPGHRRLRVRYVQLPVRSATTYQLRASCRHRRCGMATG